LDLRTVIESGHSLYELLLSYPYAYGKYSQMPRVFGSNSPWLRQPTRPFRPTRQPRTLQEGWTPFQLPNVALDLDALEKEGVRTYDEDKDREALRKQWASDTWPVMADKVGTFIRREMKWSKRAWEALESEKAHPWKISDCDVLSVALQSPALESAALKYDIPRLIQKQRRDASSKKLSATKSQETVQVSLQNGISPRLWTDSETLLRWVLHRQSVVAPMEAELDAFEERLKSPCSFDEVRRLVTAAIQTPTGLEKVGQLVDDIADQCLRSLVDRPGKKQKVLSFVNNLCISLENAGLPLGARLCELGLVASSKALYPQATLRYWTLAFGKGYLYDGSDSLEHTLRFTLSALENESSINGTESHPSLKSLRSVEARQALFCLLTGAAPTPASVLSPGLGWYAMVTYSSPEFAQSYAVLLNRLGAFRTLVAEYYRLHQYLDSEEATVGNQQHLQLSALAKELIALVHSRPLEPSNLWSENDGMAVTTDAITREQCLEHDLSQIGSYPAPALAPNDSKKMEEATALEAMVTRQAKQFEQSFQNSPSKSLEDCFKVLQSTMQLQREH